MNVHLTVAFIPGKVNTATKGATKICDINCEWMLLPKNFNWLWKYLTRRTGRKLNVHKTFRRCPRHLLTVLCTFSLRHVSTGKLIHRSICNTS